MPTTAPPEEPLVWNFVLFPVVGAVIGALTNQIAIKMLFRPYAEIRWGGVRLPFTPGVIPSQRRVIAENIATTFEAQLLSGAEIHAVLTGDRARTTVDRKVQEMLDQFGPWAAMAKPMKPIIVQKILEGVEELALDLVGEGGELDVGRLLEDKINAMDIALLEELILGFSRKQFRHITFFGGVLGALIGLVQALLVLALGTS
jgi:uncharacterized membrane protein YheB (UPF0754 family)